MNHKEQKRDDKKRILFKTNLLKVWHGKARCHYTQEKAQEHWLRLKNFLTKEEAFSLYDTWNHVNIKHSPKSHLDAECKALKEKWEKRYNGITI